MSEIDSAEERQVEQIEEAVSDASWLAEQVRLLDLEEGFAA